jgi:hypothetical protein
MHQAAELVERPYSCHRSLQNQPAGVESKPANRLNPLQDDAVLVPMRSFLFYVQIARGYNFAK